MVECVEYCVLYFCFWGEFVDVLFDVFVNGFCCCDFIFIDCVGGKCGCCDYGFSWCVVIVFYDEF